MVAVGRKSGRLLLLLPEGRGVGSQSRDWAPSQLRGDTATTSQTRRMKESAMSVMRGRAVLAPPPWEVVTPAAPPPHILTRQTRQTLCRRGWAQRC
jgi:hypothetical protein